MNEQNADNHLFYLLQQKRRVDHLGKQFSIKIEQCWVNYFCREQQLKGEGEAEQIWGIVVVPFFEWYRTEMYSYEDVPLLEQLIIYFWHLDCQWKSFFIWSWKTSFSLEFELFFVFFFLMYIEVHKCVELTDSISFAEWHSVLTIGQVISSQLIK